MKKMLMTSLLMVSMVVGFAAQAGSTARLTEGKVVVAAAATNNSADVRLTTGSDNAVVSATGTGAVGAGIVRALTYSVTGSLTNGIIAFYPYDAGVKGAALYTASLVTAGGSGRYNLTTNIYSGRLKIEVYQTTATNAASTWAWGAIVE